MCGITCIYNLDGTVINTSQLEKITNKIRHRGPDDEGYLCIDTSTNQIEFAFGKDTHPELKNQLTPLSQVNDVNLAFGFRRLAIQDLSVNGHQPMSDFTKKIFIVFNGEIYNFIELREELKSRGYQFNSMTDTEVILNAYLEWGEACVKKFNGMWAFAIWDTRTKTLFCSRDRFGIKPFYYANQNNQFVFASEIKALLESVPAEKNEETLYKYLCFDEIDTSEETFFKNIKKLPAGHNLVIQQQQLKITSYYNLEVADTIVKKDKKAIFFNRLRSAVKLRLRSDVNVGFALSGGIDSSSIVTMANDISGKEKKTTFSIVYPGKSIDESMYIDEVIAKINIENHQITPRAKDLQYEINQFIYYQEEPVPDLSYYNEYKLRGFIKENDVVVTLEGQGADEIITGYKSYVLPYYYDLIDSFQIKMLFQEIKAFNHLFPISLSKLFLRYSLNKLPQKLFQKIKSIIKPKSNPLINFEYFSSKSQPYVPLKKKNNLSSALINSLKVHSIPKQLCRGDKSAMAFSLECRYPFLDHKLVELAFSLSNKDKMQGGETKKILRDAMKELLPEKIYQRKDKKGFLSPQGTWIKELSQVFDPIVYSKSFKEWPYINWENFEREYLKLKGSSIYSANEIWKIFGVFMWEQIFINKLPNDCYSRL